MIGSPGGEGTECEGMEVTFCTRIRDERAYPALDAQAELWCRLQRRLFVDHCVRGVPLSECKKRYIARYGITARQFNALSADLRKKVDAARKSARRHVAGLERRIKAAKEKIRRLEKALKKACSPERKRRLLFVLHHKKRRLKTLEDRLEVARREAGRRVPGICFGARKLFRAQFHLVENGYPSHEAWLRDWRAARSAQFLCLGSHEETGGNQTATLFPGGSCGSGSLRPWRRPWGSTCGSTASSSPTARR